MVDLDAPERFSVRAALSRPFRIARSRTGAFTALVVFELALIAGVSLVFGPVFAGLEDPAAAEQGSPEAIRAEIQAAATFFAIVPVLIAWGVASEAAWYRLMTDRKPYFLPPYRLWADEGRVFVVYAVLFALMYVVLFVIMFAAMIPLAFILPATTGGGIAAGDTPDWANVTTLLILVIYLGLMILAVRFAVGVPVSVVDRKIRIFSGWRATRGMVWRLLAAQVVLLMSFVLIVAGVAHLAAPPVHAWLDTLPVDRDTTLFRAGLAAYFAIMLVFYVLQRSVSAEAAMVHLTRERKAAGDAQSGAPTPNPPASSAAPGRVPAGV